MHADNKSHPIGAAAFWSLDVVGYVLNRRNHVVEGSANAIGQKWKCYQYREHDQNANQRDLKCFDTAVML